MGTSPRSMIVLWVLCLFAIGCSSATDRLIAQLSDPDPKVRGAAARALGESSIDASAAIPALTDTLDDSDISVRERAIASLGCRGSAAKSSVPAIVKLLGDREPPIRLVAALAIAKIEPRSESYVPVLTESLLAGHGPMFIEVGRLGADAKWAVPTLVKLLSDQRANIRALAAQTLGEIGIGDNHVRRALEQHLRDDQPAVRKAAQQALQQIPSQPSAVAH